MSLEKIQSVLFCCDLNSVRSPMAEGICKKLHGYSIFVQSAGVLSNSEVDPICCWSFGRDRGYTWETPVKNI